MCVGNVADNLNRPLEELSQDCFEGNEEPAYSQANASDL